MSTGQIPQDDYGKPVLALWDDAAQRAIPVHIKSQVTGADGKQYAILDVNATLVGDDLRVNAQSGDFVDGAITTLGAEADVASTDSTQTNKTAMSYIKGWIKILADVWDSANHAIKVNSVTTIAGEDILNDRTKISSETAQSNTNTHNAVSVLVGSVGTTNNAVYSTAIDCHNFRSYALAAWGATGVVQALLQVSYDGGTTWQWHTNGFTSSAQFVLQISSNALIAPLCRVAVVNTSAGTQNITAYLCMNR